MPLHDEIEQAFRDKPAVGIRLDVLADSLAASIAFWQNNSANWPTFNLTNRVAIHAVPSAFNVRPDPAQGFLVLENPRIDLTYHLPGDRAQTYRTVELQYGEIICSIQPDARSPKRLRLIIQGIPDLPAETRNPAAPTQALIDAQYGGDAAAYELDERAGLITTLQWLPQSIADLIRLPRLADALKGISIEAPYNIKFIEDYLLISSTTASVTGRSASCPPSTAESQLSTFPGEVRELGEAHGNADELPEGYHSGAAIHLGTEFNRESDPPQPGEWVDGQTPALLFYVPSASLQTYMEQQAINVPKFEDGGTIVVFTWNYVVNVTVKVERVSIDIGRRALLIELKADVGGSAFALVIAGCIVIVAGAVIVGDIHPLEVYAYPHVDINAKKVYLHGSAGVVDSNVIVAAASSTLWPLSAVLSLILTALTETVLPPIIAGEINKLRFELLDLSKIGIPLPNIQQVVARHRNDSVLYGLL